MGADSDAGDGSGGDTAGDADGGARAAMVVDVGGCMDEGAGVGAHSGAYRCGCRRCGRVSRMVQEAESVAAPTTARATNGRSGVGLGGSVHVDDGVNDTGS